LAHLSRSLFHTRLLSHSFTGHHCHRRERRFICYERPRAPCNILNQLQCPIHHAGRYHCYCGEFFFHLAKTQPNSQDFVEGIAFCLVILQVHFQVGGKPRIEQPTEPRDNATDLFRGREVWDMGSIGNTTVLTSTHYRGDRG